jgi:hypothetical protein
MYKIKLLILLLVSINIVSCSQNNLNKKDISYSVGYIGGEYDGLILNNLLTNYMKLSNVYDQTSRYELRASINHASDIFITNIDNTSDRENITSNLTISIIDERYNCETFYYNDSLSQFYIYASSDKFISNQKALEKIKFDNTEALVRKFLNKINYIKLRCASKYRSNK